MLLFIITVTMVMRAMMSVMIAAGIMFIVASAIITAGITLVILSK
jgi:hypothetical protein